MRSLSGIGQLTTDNIGYEVEDNIERPIKILARGLVSQNADSSETWSATDETDITELVVEQAQYDTFLSEFDYTYSGKIVNRKKQSLILHSRR